MHGHTGTTLCTISYVVWWFTCNLLCLTTFEVHFKFLILLFYNFFQFFILVYCSFQFFFNRFSNELFCLLVMKKIYVILSVHQKCVHLMWNWLKDVLFYKKSNLQRTFHGTVSLSVMHYLINWFQTITTNTAHTQSSSCMKMFVVHGALWRTLT